MPDPDLSNTSSGPPKWPSDNFVNESEFTLSEIKRLLYWASHDEVKRRGSEAFTVFNKASVSSSGSINLHIKNPNGSGVSVDVRTFSVSSQFKGEFDVFDEFSSAPSGGSDAGIDNLLMDTEGGPADVGDAQANIGVSFTESGTHFGAALPSGGAGGQVGGALAGTEPVIEPDREIVIQLTNDGSESGIGSIGVVFAEEPYVYSNL